jgi:hypothetical protein
MLRMQVNGHATAEQRAERSQASAAASERQTAVAADDVLVFRWESDHFHLMGGTGRGAGWANIVDVGHAGPRDPQADRTSRRSKARMPMTASTTEGMASAT